MISKKKYGFTQQDQSIFFFFFAKSQRLLRFGFFIFIFSTPILTLKEFPAKTSSNNIFDIQKKKKKHFPLEIHLKCLPKITIRKLFEKNKLIELQSILVKNTQKYIINYKKKER